MANSKLIGMHLKVECAIQVLNKLKKLKELLSFSRREDESLQIVTVVKPEIK